MTHDNILTIFCQSLNLTNKFFITLSSSWAAGNKELICMDFFISSSINSLDNSDVTVSNWTLGSINHFGPCQYSSEPISSLKYADLLEISAGLSADFTYFHFVMSVESWMAFTLLATHTLYLEALLFTVF